MKDQMLIGEILFSFESLFPIPWRQEEERFRYRGEDYKHYIEVKIKFVSELPQMIVKEEYQQCGIRFGLDQDYKIVRELSAPYLEGTPTYAVSVSDGSIVTIYFIDNKNIWNNPNVHIWNMIPLENFLLRTNGFVLHCSYLMYEGRAILFSAPSGTGKTTQAKLWEKLSSARIVNGDKTIVQKKGNIWYACGFPFHGSAAECENEQYPIEAIVVVRQNTDDYIEELSLMKKFQYIYSETTINIWDARAVNNVIDLVSDLISKVKVICQQCTMKDEAYHTLHQYLEEKKNGLI